MKINEKEMEIGSALGIVLGIILWEIGMKWNRKKQHVMNKVRSVR